MKNFWDFQHHVNLIENPWRFHTFRLILHQVTSYAGLTAMRHSASDPSCKTRQIDLYTNRATAHKETESKKKTQTTTKTNTDAKAFDSRIVIVFASTCISCVSCWRSRRPFCLLCEIAEKLFVTDDGLSMHFCTTSPNEIRPFSAALFHVYWILFTFRSPKVVGDYKRDSYLYSILMSVWKIYRKRSYSISKAKRPYLTHWKRYIGLRLEFSIRDALACWPLCVSCRNWVFSGLF